MIVIHIINPLSAKHDYIRFGYSSLCQIPFFVIIMYGSISRKCESYISNSVIGQIMGNCHPLDVELARPNFKWVIM